MIWQRYPVFRIFLVFCAGILLANFMDTSFRIFLFLMGCSAAVAIYGAFSKSVFSYYRRRWLFGLCLHLFFLSLGVVITHLYSQRHAPDHLIEAPQNKVAYLIQLLDDPQKKDRSYGVQARVIGFQDSEGSRSAHSRLMLYLQKSKEAKALKYGDRILFLGNLNRLKQPMNPHEFDYKNYLNLKAIYFQAYADSSAWQYVSGGHGWQLLALAKGFRKEMLSCIDQWRLSDDQRAVTKALLLGYRYDIEDDLLRAYSSAGAMHVLAVSGLHVGIVYLMAFYLLYFLDRIKYGTVLRTLILILLLWAYATVTGLSASVVRAATMFTFVAIGTGFRRYTSIYNTILGSAIVLMLCKPTFLFEVGFQLSYAAVFGIVWLQPRFQNLWQPRHWLLRQFWAITTVSIAAQIATFPLGLYYFHQFPTLFLISNWMVIPIVTILMYVGLISLVFSAAGWVPHFLVAIYGGFLWLMNRGVDFIEEQAAFLLDQIHITRFELVLLYVLIVLSFNWLFRGGYYRLVAALSVVIVLGGSQLIESYHFKSESQMVVYSVRNHTAIGFYVNGRGVFICDSALAADDDALSFHVKHHWWANDIEDIRFCRLNEDYRGDWLQKRKAVIGFNSECIELVSGEGSGVRTGCWIVSQEAWPSNELTHFPECVILCGNQSFGHRQQWKEWGSTHSVSVWDVAEQGAYVKVYEAAPVTTSIPGSY